MKFNKNIFYLFIIGVILIISCNNIEEKKQDVIIEQKTEKPKLTKTSAADITISSDTIKEEIVDDNIYIETIDCGDDFIDTTIDYFLFTSLTIPPVFKNGDLGVLQYVKDNVKYPQSAIKDSVEGRVFVGLVIDTLGRVTNVKIIRGARSDLDSVCISAISKMPNWKPGEINGNLVKVQFVIPIKFVLNKDEETSDYVILPNDDLNFEETKIDFDLKIYPNPVISYFIIEVSELSNDMEIAIFDMQGKMLLQRKINEKTTRIETENFGKGTFIIKLFSKDLDISISKKVIINK